jgi:hypothetical protein
MTQLSKTVCLTLLLIAGILTLPGCTGGGETVISGLGNSNNYVGKDDEIRMLANALAKQDIVPAVTDEDIMTIYGKVRDKALEGDFKASVVILRLAAHQRAPKEDD